MLKNALWVLAGFLILIGGLILSSVGFHDGAWIAIAGLVVLFTAGLLSPWPLSLRWTTRKLSE